MSKETKEKNRLSLAINNNLEIESFELCFKPLTYDIYLSQFNRDIVQDTMHCVQSYGSLSRSLALRLIWAMCVTQDSKFMSFLEFIDCVEYKINDFVKGWGKTFATWYFENINEDVT